MLRPMSPRICLAVVVAAAFALLPAPSLAGKAETVHYKNLNSNTVKPPTLWFAFNNGPRVVDIQWHGWNSRRAVGYGAWMAKAAGSVGDDELDVRPARVILTNRKVCPSGSFEPETPPGTRYYTSTKIITWDSSYTKHVERFDSSC